MFIGIMLFSPGDVAGQFTAAPPTCPGDVFTFRCTVTGDRNGITTWRVGGSSECPLVHRSISSSICGSRNTFIARPVTGFGTSSPSFTSTLSGTANPALNGSLVECYGPANNVDPANRINGSTLQILGIHFSHNDNEVFITLTTYPVTIFVFTKFEFSMHRFDGTRKLEM